MKAFAAIVWLLAAPQWARAQSQGSSPMEQAMSAKLLAEIGASLQCSAADIATKAALDKALARIRDLEAKAAPAEK